MSPENLVSLSWYENERAAKDELARLREAGFEPSVHGEYMKLDEPVEILVPESQVEAARALLGIPPEGLPEEAIDAAAGPEPRSDSRPLVCPECHSGDTYKVPSYAGRALLAALVTLAVSAGFGKPEVGAAAIGLWIVAAIFFSRHAGKRRCRACGWEFAPENA